MIAVVALVLLGFVYLSWWSANMRMSELKHKQEVERLEGLIRNLIKCENGWIQEAEFMLGKTGEMSDKDLRLVSDGALRSLEDSMFSAGKAAGTAIFKDSITLELERLVGPAIYKRPPAADFYVGSPQIHALMEEIRKRRGKIWLIEKREWLNQLKEKEPD